MCFIPSLRRLPPIINALKRLNSNPEIDGEPVGATAAIPYPAATASGDDFNVTSSSYSGPPAVGLAMMATYLAANGSSSWREAAAAWGAAAVAPFSAGGSSILSTISSYILYSSSSGAMVCPPLGLPPIQSSGGGFATGVTPVTPGVTMTEAGALQQQQVQQMQRLLLASQVLLPLLARSSNQQALQQALVQVQQQAVAAAHAPQYLSVDALLLAACC